MTDSETATSEALNLSDHIDTVIVQDFTEYQDTDDIKIRFLRVQVSNIRPAVQSIIQAISDTSWVSNLIDDLIVKSFLECAQPTIEKLSRDLSSAIKNEATDSVGEYVVSLVARHIIESTYGYHALPLAEVIKEKVSGNPGFDYHHESESLILLFGEAKYKTGVNAYNAAFKQVSEFIEQGKDIKEVALLSHFLSDGAKANLAADRKGYSAAFSTIGKSFDGQQLIESIKANEHFKSLLRHEELLIVAVDIHD